MKRLFSFHGAIPRSQWWLGHALILGLALIAVIVSVVGVAAIENGENFAGSIITLLAVPTVLAIAWCSIALYVKRLRDLEWPVWLIILVFVPFVSAGFWLLLGILPTEKTADKNIQTNDA